MLRAVDAMDVAIRSQHDAFQARFGLIPSYRIGIHGGEVVVSEQGDTKRSIGIYGDPINITARLEEAARTHGLACVVPGDLVDALTRASPSLSYVGAEAIKGLSHPVCIFTYCPAPSSQERVLADARSPSNRHYATEAPAPRRTAVATAMDGKQ